MRTDPDAVAMQAALDALKDAVETWRDEMEYRSCIDLADPWELAIATLRERLAQPAPEPVAWRVVARVPNGIHKWKAFVNQGNALSAAKQWPEQFPYLSHCTFAVEPLYTTPPAAPEATPCSCAGCSKQAADGWALYCVECCEQIQPSRVISDAEIVAEAGAFTRDAHGVANLIAFARAIIAKAEGK